MPLIVINTFIDADIKTCFDLSRNIDFHQKSLKHSNEKAIAGKVSGLIELGESVTWEATHFCIKQQLTSKITEFNSPTYFVDEMVSGAFKSFKHEHIFSEYFDDKRQVNCTMMTDKFHYKSPYGYFGRLADILFLKHYMTSLLQTRNNLIKQKAEELSKIR